MWYVYLLICKDQKIYTGCTNDLKKRLDRHKKGYVLATRNRLPLKLYAYFAIQNKEKAFNFERFLKSGSGRIFVKRRLF